MATTVQIHEQAIKDLIKVKDEFDAIVESLELMSDATFMASYEEAKKQIEKRDFGEWDDL